MALYPARTSLTPTLFVSLEMDAVSISRRILSNLCKIEFSKMRTPREISRDEWEVIEYEIGKLENIPFYIIEGKNMTVAMLRNTIAEFKEKYGIKAVYIDYWQLLKKDNGRTPREESDYAEISEELRTIALEENIAVIAAAQLNREVEKRQDKRPTLADGRNTGKAEQDASIIIGLYRDEYYNGANSEEPNVIELILLKMRNGVTKTIKAFYDGRYQEVDNLPAVSDEKFEDAEFDY